MFITLKIKKIVLDINSSVLVFGKRISENIMYMFYHKRSTVISTQMGGEKIILTGFQYGPDLKQNLVQAHHSYLK